jgi:hypothetical protein
MKKKIFFLALILLAFSVNAYDSETNVEIKTINEVIPVNEFYHWIILDWTYTGPVGDTSWQECDFESPDKNYGIFLDVDYSSNPRLIEEFGPETVKLKCNLVGGEYECTARTTYFFKLSHSDGSYSIPVNIRGKCGVVDEELAYPIDMNYDYNFSVNSSYESIVPDINYITKWGKSGTGSQKDAELKVVVHDPQNKNITEIEWTAIPAGCSKGSEIDSGIDSPDANSEITLSCDKKGIKVVVVSAENEDGYKGFKGFLTYFSDNDNEVEFSHINNDVLIGLPNVTKSNMNTWNLQQDYNYKLSSIQTKTLTVLKDTGNGLPSETDYGITLEDSTPFVSVLNPECPGIAKQQSDVYAGEDFNLVYHSYLLGCEPGNHKVTFNSTGVYSNGTPFNLSDDFNFVAADINFNILNLVKTSEELAPLYGIVYGENGSIDLNVIIDNYSPEFIEIKDVNLVYVPFLSTPRYYNENYAECTFEETEIVNENPEWKINSYLECPRFHEFYPVVYLNGFPEFKFPGPLIFWVLESTDKFKMDSLSIENLHDFTWNPDTNLLCDPKTEDCEEIGAEGEGETGLISLPQDTLKITKGDLLRFHAIVTNVYSQGLNGEVVIKITDSQGNEVAEISQLIGTRADDPGIDSLTKKEFDVLFYDTDYLRESQLYTVTATVYWIPEYGFRETDKKPLNNTKIAYFYVLGESLTENLPETNLNAVIIILFFVVLILLKKKEVGTK